MATKPEVISTAELRSLIDSGQELVLLNVLPENYFKREHIPGSMNVDGYKMDFIEELEKTGVKQDSSIIVYASGSDSEASTYAAERMLKRGWSRVKDYREGVAGWRKAGLTLQETVATVDPERSKNTYTVDVGQSLLLWAGRNMNSIHRGTLKIKEGRMVFDGDGSLSGEVVIDMNSITNTDLTDPMWNKMLVTHLKSEDFFETELYPVARIIFKQSERIAEKICGVPNFTVTAEVSIKDVTRALVFPTSIIMEEDGTLKAHAHFDLDRTLWNVKYGSSKFFKMLGMHLVDDLITLDMKLVAQ